MKGTLVVIFFYFLARIFPRGAVRQLVSALGSRQEDTSAAAYMALVKLGPRVASCLLDEAQAGRETASVLQILGDQGDKRVIPELEKFSHHPDPVIASAARESLAILYAKGAEDGEADLSPRTG